MPIYEYQCENCGHRFELKQSFKDKSVVTCPQCGGKAGRIFVPVPIIFKGSGFYVTDKLAEERRLKGRRDGDRPAGAGKKAKFPKEGKKEVKP